MYCYKVIDYLVLGAYAAEEEAVAEAAVEFDISASEVRAIIRRYRELRELKVFDTAWQSVRVGTGR
jgi:hypothetical protein